MRRILGWKWTQEPSKIIWGSRWGNRQDWSESKWCWWRGRKGKKVNMRALRTSELEEMEDEWKTAQKKGNRWIINNVGGHCGWTVWGMMSSVSGHAWCSGSVLEVLKAPLLSSLSWNKSPAEPLGCSQCFGYCLASCRLVPKITGEELAG